MIDQWYFTRDRDTFGPVSLQELQQLAATGQLVDSSLVWREGMADWLPATAELTGQAIPIDLQESQTIQVQIHERKPW